VIFIERSSFFDSIDGDRRYRAEDWAGYFRSFIGNGVFPLPSNGLQVIAGIGTQAIVRAGQGFINGYFYTNTEELTLDLPIAHGVLNRVDRVVVRWDLMDRNIRIQVNSGVPASNPVPIPLQRDADAYELCIADIRVGNGVTQITQASITDQRWNTELCGVVAGVVQQIDPSFITAQFSQFFNEMRPRIEEDYIVWVHNIETMYAQYRTLVENGFAQWEQDIDNFFGLIQQNVIGQFNTFVNFLNAVRGDSQTAFESFITWLNGFRSQGEQDFNTWFDSIRGILDEDAAGQIVLLIEELQSFIPTHKVGVISHGLNAYPQCTLHRLERGAGIGGAGEGGAGGAHLVTVPAEFELGGKETVTVYTTTPYARMTEIHQIHENMYALVDPDRQVEQRSLFLIMR